MSCSSIGGDGTVRGAMQHRRARSSAAGCKIGGGRACPRPSTTTSISSTAASASRAPIPPRSTSIRSAHVEATGRAQRHRPRSKLMGRHSGFVACHAALASTDVDLVLIPEVAGGSRASAACSSTSTACFDRKGHAVVVVAEGAAQELHPRRAAAAPAPTRAATPSFKDVGVFLRDRIVAALRSAQREVTLKYIDPSYAIRSVPASPSDSVYCWNMARNAVHAAHGGQHRDADRPLARALRARADATRHSQPKAGRAVGRSLDERDRVDGASRRPSCKAASSPPRCRGAGDVAPIVRASSVLEPVFGDRSPRVVHSREGWPRRGPPRRKSCSTPLSLFVRRAGARSRPAQA